MPGPRAPRGPGYGGGLRDGDIRTTTSLLPAGTAAITVRARSGCSETSEYATEARFRILNAPSGPELVAFGNDSRRSRSIVGFSIAATSAPSIGLPFTSTTRPLISPDGQRSVRVTSGIVWEPTVTSLALSELTVSVRQMSSPEGPFTRRLIILAIVVTPAGRPTGCAETSTCAPDEKGPSLNRPSAPEVVRSLEPVSSRSATTVALETGGPSWQRTTPATYCSGAIFRVTWQVWPTNRRPALAC
jgi:hypothetical protein